MKYVSNINTDAETLLTTPTMNFRHAGVTNAKMRTLEGRKHWIVPVTMLVVGVHNGSNGPITYTANELKASVRQWNGKPVVVYHPQLNGKGVSAANPDIIDRQRIGTIYNTAFDGKRLTAEAWIDAERVEQVDERVADAVRLGQNMEVSTGLYFALEGEIARNYQPDHLALLPDLVGACSIADGCGMARNTAKLALNTDDDVLALPSLDFS